METELEEDSSTLYSYQEGWNGSVEKHLRKNKELLKNIIRVWYIYSITTYFSRKEEFDNLRAVREH